MVFCTRPEPSVRSTLPSERTKWVAYCPADTCTYDCPGGGFIVLLTLPCPVVRSIAPSERSRYDAISSEDTAMYLHPAGGSIVVFVTIGPAPVTRSTLPSSRTK